jgi:uncharacterized alkaline shock family protein YloU
MNFIKKLLLFIYLVIMVCAGALFIVLSVGMVSTATWTDMIGSITESVWTQATVAVLGLIVALAGIIGYFRGIKKIKTSKLITFHNPDGEVTVSLSAIENYVKRVAKDIPGITDAKSVVSVNKRGINVVSHITIDAGTNIPDATERIQMIVKSKIQDMIGVEEKINIKMHVGQIMKGSLPQQQPAGEEEEETANVPFREIE